MVEYIIEILDQLDPSMGRVCDLFAGSGTVSGYLSKKRNVTAIDIQEYSRVICSALLKPAPPSEAIKTQVLEFVGESSHSKLLNEMFQPLIEHEAECYELAKRGNSEPLCHLIENGSLIAFEIESSSVNDTPLKRALIESSKRVKECSLDDKNKTMISRYFGGVYFSYYQTVQMDLILEAISKLPSSYYDTCLASLLSTASDIVNTVGKHFAQPIRPRNSNGQPKSNLLDAVYRDRFINPINIYENWLSRYMKITKSVREHKVICDDYATALRQLNDNFGVIYADPPYTRDHYSRYYHVLETICMRDNPAISESFMNGDSRLSRGLYRVERHQSPFCIKSKAPNAFKVLFNECRNFDVPLVVSYSPYDGDNGSRPRLMTVDGIGDIAKKYFKRIDVISVDNVVHNKLNRSDMNFETSKNAEVLIVCTP